MIQVSRQKYKTTHEIPEGEYIAQLKFDGIWGALMVREHKWHILSRTGTLKASGVTDIPYSFTLIGEYLIGSNWAVSKPELYGKFFTFDCVEMQDKDFRALPYEQRYHIASTIARAHQPDFAWLSDVITLAPSIVNEAWELIRNNRFSRPVNGVIVDSWEGLVFRKPSDTWHQSPIRLKPAFEKDFVALGFIEGAGRLKGSLGSIIAGDLGTCTPTCDVGGGLTDSWRRIIWEDRLHYTGKEFTAKGNRLFETGALRHPVFVKWNEE